MYANDARGLESPERQAESTDNYAVCPNCGAPILALTTSGPAEHFFEPCGCRASLAATSELASIDEPRAMADGGISFTDLHAFERDLLYAIRALEGDEPPKGLALKEYLEADYREEINHSRLYQNLDALIERGLVTKGEKDARTNEYATTVEGRRLVERHAEHRAEQVGLAVEEDEPRAMTDGGIPTDTTEQPDPPYLHVSGTCYLCGDPNVDPEDLCYRQDGTWCCSKHCDDPLFTLDAQLNVEVVDETEQTEQATLLADGGFETRRLRVGPARTVAYGPARADSGEWALRFTSEDGERVVVRLDEDAMYELWTEVHNVPWPSREDDRHDFQRELVARAERADIETLREAVDVLGGER